MHYKEYQVCIYIIREEVKKCAAKLENRKVAGADQNVNEFMKYLVRGKRNAYHAGHVV